MLLILGCLSISDQDLADRLDQDGDGSPRPEDCDDHDPDITISSWWSDNDGDGFGSGTSIEDCTQPDGFVEQDGDCDDEQPETHPDASDFCDDIDNNCNGSVDEDATFAEYFPDDDGDGFGAEQVEGLYTCDPPSGYVDNNDDCNDENEYASSWDTDYQACAGSCEIALSPNAGEWTEKFAADTSCECTENNTDCHTLYQGRIDAVEGNQATLSFQKVSGGAPSTDVSYWIAVGEDDHPSCVDLEEFTVRASGIWSTSEEVLTVDLVDIWPTEDDFHRDEDGAMKRLFIITGGGDLPKHRIWFQETTLRFTRTCE